MAQTFQRSLLIVLAGIVAGLIVNAVSPRRIPFITPPRPVATPTDEITLTEAERLWRSGGAFFLDARHAADYAAGHIPNAFNLSAETFTEQFPAVAALLTPDTPLVVYCDGVRCELSHELHARLKQLGYHRVRVLINGWTVWQRAGLPATIGAQP